MSATREICPHCNSRLFFERDANYGLFLHCLCGYDELVGAPELVMFEGRSGRHPTEPIVSNRESTRRYRLGMKARATA